MKTLAVESSVNAHHTKNLEQNRPGNRLVLANT